MSLNPGAEICAKYLPLAKLAASQLNLWPYPASRYPLNIFATFLPCKSYTLISTKPWLSSLKSNSIVVIGLNGLG